MFIDDIPLEERIRLGSLDFAATKKVNSSETPIGQALKSIHEERMFMRSILEKIANTSDSYESKLARSAIEQIDNANKNVSQ